MDENPAKPHGGSLGEWVFQGTSRPGFDSRRFTEPSPEMIEEEEEEELEPLKTQSLTPNAIQLNWKYPVRFPCCPQEYSGNPLEAYMANLEEGKVFSTNEYRDSSILSFGMPQPDCLWVMCDVSIGWKTHAFTKITFKDGIYYHENKGVYDFGDDPEKLFKDVLKGKIG